MKLPSLSIAEMMAIIALVALDCVAIRVRSLLILYPLIFGGLPMQIALVIGLLLLFRQRRRRRTLSPFLIGFEVVGWIALLVYVAVCILAPLTLDEHLTHILTLVVDAIHFQTLSTPDWICRYGIAMTYLTAPQLAAALVAGWINQTLSEQAHPETVPTHD